MPSHNAHRKLRSDIFEGIGLDGDISLFGKSRNRIKLSFGREPYDLRCNAASDGTHHMATGEAALAVANRGQLTQS